MKRKFISFTNDELSILKDAIDAYGEPNLLKQIREEMKIREYNKKRHEEWLNQQPKIYCC